VVLAPLAPVVPVPELPPDVGGFTTGVFPPEAGDVVLAAGGGAEATGGGEEGLLGAVVAGLIPLLKDPSAPPDFDPICALTIWASTPLSSGSAASSIAFSGVPPSRSCNPFGSKLVQSYRPDAGSSYGVDFSPVRSTGYTEIFRWQDRRPCKKSQTRFFSGNSRAFPLFQRTGADDPPPFAGGGVESQDGSNREGFKAAISENLTVPIPTLF